MFYSLLKSKTIELLRKKTWRNQASISNWLTCLITTLTQQKTEQQIHIKLTLNPEFLPEGISWNNWQPLCSISLQVKKNETFWKRKMYWVTKKESQLSSKKLLNQVFTVLSKARLSPKEKLKTCWAHHLA